MPYFSKFPILKYPVKDGTAFRFAFVSNILRRVGLNEDLKNGEGIFLEYNVKDGERPEQIAERVYGDPSFSWLVLLTNDIVDPYHGWYRSSNVLQNLIQKKYGSTSVFFTDFQDRFLYGSTFSAGCTLWQGTISGKVMDYHPTICRLSVDKIGYAASSGNTAFVEMPQTNTVNYISDSYAKSNLPSGQWAGYEHTVSRVYINDETSITEATRKEMMAVSPYWVKCVKNSSVNGRVGVLDTRSSSGVTHSFMQDKMYRLNYYVYSQDSNLSTLSWESDNLTLNNRVITTKYTPSQKNQIIRLRSDFYTQSLGSNQGNLMVLRSGTNDAVGTVFYLTGIELNVLDTVDISIKRVEPSANAVNHFSVDRPTGVCGASEKVKMDPLSKESFSYTLLGSVVGSTASEYPSSTQGVNYSGSGVVAFGETFIGRYMGLCGSQSNGYSVSNQKNEYNMNEELRTIKVLHPRYKRQAVEQLEALLRV